MVFAQIKVITLESADACVVVRDIKVAGMQAVLIDNSPVSDIRISGRAIR